MLLRFQKPAVRGNYATGNQAFSMPLRFLAIRDERLRRFVDLLEIHRSSLVAEEAQEFLQHFFRLLFCKIMSCVKGPSFHRRARVLSPDFENVPELPDRAPLHPTMRAREPQFCVRLSHRPHPYPGRFPQLRETWKRRRFIPVLPSDVVFRPAHRRAGLDTAVPTRVAPQR
jgi:hypothetical protein